MKAIKLVVVFFVVYVGIVVAFETLIGVFQPATDTTLVITTTGDDDVSNDRVLARLESDGQLYVAANHWPRAWYNEALENPAVQVTYAGETKDYVAVPIGAEEYARVNGEHSLGPIFRFVTGFPKREILRLDPR